MKIGGYFFQVQIFRADFSVRLVILKFTKLLFARMVRNYKRKSGSREYANYSDETLQKCLHQVSKNIIILCLLYLKRLLNNTMTSSEFAFIKN